MKEAKTKEKFIELRASGFSYDKISSELKVSKQTLISWSKDLEVEIKNLKTIQIEALQEKYLLQKQHRLANFGELLGKLRSELVSRAFTDIPTEKLFELLVRLQLEISKECGDAHFEGHFVEPFNIKELKKWPA